MLKYLYLFLSLIILIASGIYLANQEFAVEKENTPRRKTRLEVKLPKNDSPNEFRKFHASIRSDEDAPHGLYPFNHRTHEWKRAVERQAFRRNNSNLEWLERGPANVGGRTRSVLIDPRDTDYNTWILGSAGGGVWKTEDAGESWINLTGSIPNLSTTSLAMSAQNPDIIYAGTGEGFGAIDHIQGSGIWKTIDGGETWEPLEQTMSDNRFTIVSRLAIDPENDSVVIASTYDSREDFDGHLLKTTDGGQTWRAVRTQRGRRIQQVISPSTTFNPLYASINSVGILKSTDAGETWDLVFDDINEFQIRRMEIAIDPNDFNNVYIACESDITSVLYRTQSGGDDWQRIIPTNADNEFGNWLSGQGWYDNTIAVHPFQSNTVFVAGAGPMLEISSTGMLDSFLRIVDRIEDSPTLELITNDGSSPTGIDPVSGIAGILGIDTELENDELRSVVLTFEEGDTNLIHELDFSLADFGLSFDSLRENQIVARDAETGERLVVSYIDIRDDDMWNPGFIEEFQTGETPEYIMVHNLTYDTIPADAIEANPLYKGLFLFALGTSRTGPFEGSFTVLVGAGIAETGNLDVVTDGYFEYFNRGFAVGTKGVHVDHHNIIPIPIDAEKDSFLIMNANDGGIAFSENSGETFKQTGVTFDRGAGEFEFLFGYNTSQFYGIDKRNGLDQYIGGTQDNGTWVSEVSPDEMSNWFPAPSGDGFECAWNYDDGNLVLETSQFNGLFRSTNGGIDFDFVSIPDGPFITRLSASKQDANLVYMTSEEGLLKSNDFFESFDILDMPDDWVENSLVRVSLADPNVVWTGQRIREGRNSTFVSVDGGFEFTQVTDYTDDFTGRITNFATNPLNRKSTLLTFGLYNSPKVVKTSDFGQTWEDISGFASTESPGSNRGFPDVVTYCALIMPYDTNTIWVGTEIGLVETNDGGATWALADNGLPPVSIWEMKIINDEVVVATHGRGVWSVSIPELEGYEPLPTVLGPIVRATNLVIDGALQAEVELRADYDSTIAFIYVDSITEENAVRIKISEANVGEQVITVDDNIDITFPTPDTIQPIFIQLQSYLDDRVLKSLSTVEAIQIYEPINTNAFFSFDDERVMARDLFNIVQPEGFDNLALHSLHPYPENNVLLRAFFQHEVIVNEETSMMTFDQIVLVEPGEPGTEFGDDEFWDFAAIFGSNDRGQNWEPLQAIDARANERWLLAYNFGRDGSPDLIRNDTIHLDSTFALGDTVLLQFVLLSDPAVNGWGWMVDNLEFGALPTSTLGFADFSTSVSPNPVSDIAQVEWVIRNADNNRIELYDVLGKRVMSQQIQGRIGNYQHILNTAELNSGQYLLRIISGDKQQNVPLIKQ